MVVSILFIIAALAAAGYYLFGKNKFSPLTLLVAIWLLAIGVSQWRLSPYEETWSLKFWLILALFFVVFVLSGKYFSKVFINKMKSSENELNISGKIILILVSAMNLAALAVNFYIYQRFGTLPILSTMPDRMRFIINREVFGLWEYIALLPRLTIPMAFSYFLVVKNKVSWQKIFIIINIVLGFLILSLYASRLVIVFAVLLSYFVYLGFRIKKINFKKIIAASAIAAVIVLVVAIAIPVFRQYITYRDYYGAGGDFFNYIVDLSQLRLPESLRFIAPLYIIPSFNLQALSRATDFFGIWGTHFGGYSISVVDPVLKIFHLPEFDITVPWKEMFLPWWVTATFLFSFWVDGGVIGIIVAAIFLAGVLSVSFIYLNKKTHWLAVFLFAYLSFVVIMSIYTNYFMRSEVYLDLVVILGVYWLLTKWKMYGNLK